MGRLMVSGEVSGECSGEVNGEWEVSSEWGG